MPADFKDVAAIVGPIVAAASLGFNVYQWSQLRRSRAPVARLEEIRQSLLDTLNKFDSRLLSVPAFMEQFDQGFRRLAEILPILGNCNRVMSSAPDPLVPSDIKVAVNTLHRDADALYYFQDSFINFAEGAPFVPYNKIQQWPQVGEATRALHVLQTDYGRVSQRLHQYLRSIS